MRVSGHKLLIRILFLCRRCAIEQGVHDPGMVRKLFRLQVCIPFHHFRRFPRTHLLYYVQRHALLRQSARIGMPQVVPAEIFDPDPL